MSCIIYYQVYNIQVYNSYYYQVYNIQVYNSYYYQVYNIQVYNSYYYQVRRIGAASKANPLYVPATYVVEVPITPLSSAPQQQNANNNMCNHGNMRLQLQSSVSLCSNSQYSGTLV